MKERVAVAMSGGVDSSVAAALLLDAGYDVIGVTMEVYPGATAAADAQRVAGHLGIPFYRFSLEEAFAREVVEYFTGAYLQGLTPNPCVVCNRKIKFQALAEEARKLGAAYFATGHYVRKGYEPELDRFTLARGKDPKKDQSYVLFGLTQEQLARSLFPLGGYEKEEVRALARQWNLPSAGKAESQEICFIPNNDYSRFLEEKRPEAVRPGNIRDTSGRILGRHRGVAFYTIGQRRGLGIADTTPYYVVALRPEECEVIVGKAGETYREECRVTMVNWVSIPPPREPLPVTVKIRYTAPAVPAVLEPAAGEVRIRFAKPQRAVTPGQAAVFYREDLVLGGGFIT
jgi:tRNA-specific 2-thiouridylase